MKNKEFIPYEEALVLKELGFDEDCIAYYGTFGFHYLEINANFRITLLEHSGKKSDCILSPTFSQAFRFFREKYKIMYTINYGENDKWYGSFTKIGGNYSSDYTESLETFEEAQLASLNKLIDLCKQN